MPMPSAPTKVRLLSGPLDGYSVRLSEKRLEFPFVRVENEIYAEIPDMGDPPHVWRHVLSWLCGQAVAFDHLHKFSALAMDEHLVGRWITEGGEPPLMDIRKFELLKLLNEQKVRIPLPALEWQMANCQGETVYDAVNIDIDLRVVPVEGAGFRAYHLTDGGVWTPAPDIRPTLELAQLDCWECWNQVQLDKRKLR